MNIEIIGNGTNKVDKSETAIIKRIIDAHASELSDEKRIENNLFGLKLRMNSYLNQNINSQIISTGEFLNEILTILKLRKNKFAQFIELEEPNLHAILKGRRKINNKIAKKLELIFNINEQLWLFIETKNEIKKFNQTNKISKSKYSIKQLMKEKTVSNNR